MNMAASSQISVNAQPIFPASFRGKQLEKTGPYLNDSEHRKVIMFPVEGQVSRCFTVMIALGTHGDNAVQLEKNGVVIIDNDNWSVVADGLRAQASSAKGVSADQRKMFKDICAMKWSEFSAFCRSLPNVRKGIPDIDTPCATPKAGCRERQEQIGVYKAPDIDNRDDFIRSINECGLYNLPFTTKAGMIREIMFHPTAKIGSDMHLSWDIRMNHAWDKSGRIEDGEELCQSMDAKWREAIEDEPRIIANALEEILEPYLDSGFSALEIEAAQAEIAQTPDEETLYLKSFSGQCFAFKDHSGLREKLEAFDENDLMNIWVTMRVVDADLSRKNRTIDVQNRLNTVRHEMEQVWLEEVEEELQF